MQAPRAAERRGRCAGYAGGPPTRRSPDPPGPGKRANLQLPFNWWFGLVWIVLDCFRLVWIGLDWFALVV